MRELYHAEYVTGAAREAQGMARIAGETNQDVLNEHATKALLEAHRLSPYRSPSEPDQTQQPDRGHER